MSNEMVKAESSNVFVNGMYSSITAETQEDRLALFDVISNSDLLSDHVGDVLKVSDIVLQPVEVEDMATGEQRQMVRAVVVTEDGKAYSATSTGIETALKNLFVIVGEPTYEPAIPLKVVEKPGRKGFKFLTLEYAPKGK